jgi:hypothetical protein
MFAQRLFSLSLATLCVLGASRFAAAQARLYEPKPLSGLSGPTGEAMRDIYRTSVGQGYTSQSLNTIALQYARERVPYVGQSTTRTTTGPSLGIGANNLIDKPFSSFSPSPTVSPYLNLFREDFEGNSDLNYNTLVQPQLQQQQFNQQVQRQAIDQARRLETLSARVDFNPQGAKDEFPTGHRTVYRYTGHYYQMPTTRQRRR